MDRGPHNLSLFISPSLSLSCCLTPPCPAQIQRLKNKNFEFLPGVHSSRLGPLPGSARGRRVPGQEHHSAVRRHAVPAGHPDHRGMTRRRRPDAQDQQHR